MIVSLLEDCEVMVGTAVTRVSPQLTDLALAGRVDPVEQRPAIEARIIEWRSV